MSGVVWTTDPTVCLEPRVTGEGYGSREPQTVIEVLKNCVEKYGTEVAFQKEYPAETKAEDGETPEMEWRVTTWNDYYADCRRFAKALISLGFEPHRSVNIIGFNSPEWFVADVGAIFAGGIAAGIYTTNLSDACQYICGELDTPTQISHHSTLLHLLIIYPPWTPCLLCWIPWVEHSQAEVVVAEGMKQLAKFAEISHNLPNLKALVVYGGLSQGYHQH